MTVASRSFIVVALLGSIASAQPANVDAEALFREGRRLLKDGKIGEACEKLEASARLDESVGTLLNVGDCREKNGQLATAWAAFLKAASAAHVKHDDREPVAGQRAAALEPRLSFLTISVPEASRVDGLAITRDGATIDTALWNQGVPVDAGIYEIGGSAPGHEAWSTRVVFRSEAEKQSVEVPRFKPLRELAVAKPLPTPVEAASHDEERDDAPPPSRFTRLRKVSLGTAAVGLVGIAGGIRWGLEAKDLDRQANAICPGTVCSDPHGRALNHSAQQDALASEVMFGVGGAAIVGAAVMWWLGAPATVTATDHSVAIGGRF
jgi:hypothetical protein